MIKETQTITLARRVEKGKEKKKRHGVVGRLHVSDN